MLIETNTLFTASICGYGTACSRRCFGSSSSTGYHPLERYLAAMKGIIMAVRCLLKGPFAEPVIKPLGLFVLPAGPSEINACLTG
jgi:hypothetical protein